MGKEICFFTLLRGARVLAPRDLGIQDILIAGEKIAAIGSCLEGLLPGMCQTVDLRGALIMPGLIDGHVHLIGGGGEGGYATRTPEVTLSGITKVGVTTVVGCLGTDGTTRHMTSLLAKARALETEGISAYIYTGAYEVPGPTLTGSVRSDLVLIDKVIGTGEVAISDHRSSQPLKSDIQKLAAEARVGGLLGGKAGVIHMHVGDGKAGLAMLFAIIEESEIPITQFVPTHVNRSPALFKQAIQWGKLGGWLDITSGVYPSEGCWDAIRPSKAIYQAVAAGVALQQITMSSDSNGSLPAFDDRGNPSGVSVATEDSLFDQMRELHTIEGISLPEAVQIVTSNVAHVLKLWPRKGGIEVGADADFVVLTPDIKIQQVWARGRQVVEGSLAIVKGTFE